MLFLPVSTTTIQSLGFLPFEGKVNLEKPNHEFGFLEDYGMDPNNVPEKPVALYFGRWVSSLLHL